VADFEEDVQQLARDVLAEDGPVDATTDVLQVSGAAIGTIRARENAVAAGLSYAAAIGRLAGCMVRWEVDDGGRVPADAPLGVCSGGLSALLRAERPILNVLQRACGIATTTRRYVDAVAGTGCRILHTRKTAPRLRVFDIASVLAGGGHAHRLGLDRIVMIKDNHWEALQAAGGDLSRVVAEARRRGVLAVQIEVESDAQVDLACRAGADRLLVDNRPPVEFAALAARARRQRPAVEIEATGGITLADVRAYAEAGADFVSVGALTHSVRAVDLTLELHRD